MRPRNIDYVAEIESLKRRNKDLESQIECLLRDIGKAVEDAEAAYHETSPPRVLHLQEQR